MAGESGLNGWLTFLVYLGTAWLCFRNVRGSVALAEAGVRRVALARSRRRFWLVMASLLLLLGFTRQFDIQTLAAVAMRGLLAADDVYGERRGLQLGLIIAIGTFGTFGLLIALFSFRRAEASILAALVASAALVIFTIIRTASLHDIDRFLRHGTGVPDLQINNLIELSLLAAIAIASFAFSRQIRRETENARLRALSIQERRRLLGEKRRAGRS